MIARDEAPVPARAIRFTPRALDELRDAVAWYELGAPAVVPAFLLALDAVIAQAARYPDSFPVVRPDIRRALLRRFPYGVFYSNEPEALIVVAIVHARRDPALWPSGVSNRGDR